MARTDSRNYGWRSAAGRNRPSDFFEITRSNTCETSSPEWFLETNAPSCRLPLRIFGNLLPDGSGRSSVPLCPVMIPLGCGFPIGMNIFHPALRRTLIDAENQSVTHAHGLWNVFSRSQIPARPEYPALCRSGQGVVTPLRNPKLVKAGGK